MASSVPQIGGSVLDPSLGALYGPSVIPDLGGLGGSAVDRALGLNAGSYSLPPSPFSGGFAAFPAPAGNAIEDAVRLACACGIDGCDCDEALTEVNGNNSLLNHLQQSFQAQQLSTLVSMLIQLMQNRGLVKARGQGKKDKKDKVDKAAGAGGGGGHGHSHGDAKASHGSSSSEATSGGGSTGEVEAVTRQGEKIGAKIADQFDKMVAAAAKDGVKLQIESGLRTHAEQEKLYAAYLNGTGNLAAKPGTSNHESGEAIDYSNTPGAFDWLKKNAAKFGFHGNVPGEPWHYSLTGN